MITFQTKNKKEGMGGNGPLLARAKTSNPLDGEMRRTKLGLSTWYTQKHQTKARAVDLLHD